MDEMTFVATYLGHAGLHVRNVSNNIYPQIPNMAKVTRGNGLWMISDQKEKCELGKFLKQKNSASTRNKI